jgi:hypothetical protein
MKDQKKFKILKNRKKKIVLSIVIQFSNLQNNVFLMLIHNKTILLKK